MDVNWKQTGKGTWSSGAHDRGIEARPIWTATVRQRKSGKETTYSWMASGFRKGTYSGIAASLAAAKEAAIAAVQTHIVPAGDGEAAEASEAAAEAGAEESASAGTE
jgi:hypothetical protein